MSTIGALSTRESHSAGLAILRGSPASDASRKTPRRFESLHRLLGPVRLVALTIALVASAVATGWALSGPQTESEVTKQAQRLSETSSSSSGTVAVALTVVLVLSLLAGWLSWRRHRASRA